MNDRIHGGLQLIHLTMCVGTITCKCAMEIGYFLIQRVAIGQRLQDFVSMEFILIEGKIIEE